MVGTQRLRISPQSNDNWIKWIVTDLFCHNPSSSPCLPRQDQEERSCGSPGTGTISRHIICSGQLFAQFFRSHPEELPEAQRGQLQAQEAVRRLILSVPGPELV